MRKYVVGILIGFALSFAVGAHAEIVGVVGKTIEGAFPVKVSGKQLEQSAIVVEGTSYLPVRAIGDALNMDVAFNADLGIELKKKEVVPAVTSQQTSTLTQQPILTPEEKANKIQGIDTLITSANESISRNQPLLLEYKKNNPNHPAVKALEESIQRDKDQIAELEKQKAELLK